MPLPIPLIPQQVAALPILRWLYSDENRREGRSTIQALVYLQHAVEYPGRWVHPVDHFLSRDMNLYLCQLCVSWATELSLTFDTNYSANTIAGFRITSVSPQACQLFEPYGLPVPVTVPLPPPLLEPVRPSAWEVLVEEPQI